jgi:hypothetical protein
MKTVYISQALLRTWDSIGGDVLELCENNELKDNNLHA